MPGDSIRQFILSHRAILMLAAILAIVLIVLSPCLKNDFVPWDDRPYILNNPEIEGLDTAHLKTIFTSRITHGYIPLTILSFAVENHFFGKNAFVFHLTNLLLHLMVVALIFWLGLRLGLGIWACGLAVLIFGIHPMHVESVAWIAQRKDVLYSVFYLAAIHAYLTHLDTSRRRFLILTFIFGILSMLSKSMALSLPLILIVCAWMKGRKLSVRDWLAHAVHLLYIMPIAWATYTVLAKPPTVPKVEAILTWLWCAAFYPLKFLFPFPVSPIYPRPEPVSLVNPIYWATIAVLIGYVWLFIRFRHHRWSTFAWLFWLMSIFFLFRCTTVEFNVVADRYMYLPSVGFCFLIGWMTHQAWAHFNDRLAAKIVLAAVAVMIVIALSMHSFAHCGVWKDGLALWRVMIRDSRHSNALVYYNRAKIYEFRKDYDLAIADYDEAIKIDPAYAAAYINRGVMHFRLKHTDAALADLNRAIELEPHAAPAYLNRSAVYGRQGNFKAAIEDALRAQSLGYPLPPGYLEQLRTRDASS